jgi:hypothetical protein
MLVVGLGGRAYESCVESCPRMSSKAFWSGTLFFFLFFFSFSCVRRDGGRQASNRYERKGHG